MGESGREEEKGGRWWGRKGCFHILVWCRGIQTAVHYPQSGASVFFFFLEAHMGEDAGSWQHVWNWNALQDWRWRRPLESLAVFIWKIFCRGRKLKSCNVCYCFTFIWPGKNKIRTNFLFRTVAWRRRVDYNLKQNIEWHKLDKVMFSYFSNLECFCISFFVTVLLFGLLYLCKWLSGLLIVLLKPNSSFLFVTKLEITKVLFYLSVV